MYRAGIAGCGNIARVHGEILKNLEDVELAAFCDGDVRKAEACAKACGQEGAHSYTSLDEMLEKENLDVLHICLPHYLHVPAAENALQRGVHVFMEKPPAITREQFNRLEEAEKKSGARLGICFQNRYNEAVLEAGKVLSTGELGRIKGARAFVTWHRDKTYYTDSNWRGKKETEGGGVLINQAVHTLDLLAEFMGRPLKTEAGMTNHHLKSFIDVEDTLEAYIQFGSGEACFYATNAYALDAPVFLEIACEKGTLRLEGNELLVIREEGTKKYTFEGKTVIGKSYWGSSHGVCIADYYRCIGTHERYRNDLQSCRKIFSLMMDIYEAAEKQSVVLYKGV